MQIAYTAQIINQLFHLLNLACTYGDAFCGLIPMLMSKNVNIDVSKDSPFHTFQLPLVSSLVFTWSPKPFPVDKKDWG